MVPPPAQTWPSIACSDGELKAVRRAFGGRRPWSGVVRRRVNQARLLLQRARGVVHVDRLIPAGFGQHMQWYNCPSCEMYLETLSARHHRCPKCSVVYSGYPYDNVVYKIGHRNLALQIENCAWAFAITGDERFGECVGGLLAGYAGRYCRYPVHSNDMATPDSPVHPSGARLFEQTLSEAAWVIRICRAYDLSRVCESISDEHHEAIRGLLNAVHITIASFPMGKSNWQTFHNAALACIGGVLGDPSLVELAIQDQDNGFYYQMANSVLPGGIWYEGSWDYHLYTLEGLTALAEAARRLDIDLYSSPELRAMYQAPLEFLLPDGTLPRLGDCSGGAIPSSLFEAAYRYWRDESFLSILETGFCFDSVLYERDPQSPSPSRKVIGSVWKPGAGYAVLRVDAGPSEGVVVFNAGSTDGDTLVIAESEEPFVPRRESRSSHAHFDRLSFIYYAGRREVVTDRGRAERQAYSLPIHRDWYRATLSHSTVVVDCTSQESSSGVMDFFQSCDELCVAIARTDDAYPGVRHQRALFLRGTFLLVVDSLESVDGGSRTFDMMLHSPCLAIEANQEWEATDRPDGQGYQYLEDVQGATTDDLVVCEAVTRTDRVAFTVNAERETEIWTASGPGVSVMERIPLLGIRRSGRRATFVSVIEVVNLGESKRVQDVHISSDQDGFEVVLMMTNRTQEIYYWGGGGGASVRPETPGRCEELIRGAYSEVLEAGPRRRAIEVHRIEQT